LQCETINQITMENETKIIITSGQLKKWLDDNGIKLGGLEKATGTTPGQLSGMFNKTIYRGRDYRRFSQNAATRLNTGMRIVSENLLGHLLTYSPEDAKLVGTELCHPSCLEQIGELRPWLMVKPFLRKALGWTDSHISNVFISKKCEIYGHIREEDIVAINTYLVMVAAALNRFEMLRD